jgi:hypothetical protein
MRPALVHIRQRSHGIQIGILNVIFVLGNKQKNEQGKTYPEIPQENTFKMDLQISDFHPHLTGSDGDANYMSYEFSLVSKRKPDTMNSQ